jgi:hypothetical protein
MLTFPTAPSPTTTPTMKGISHCDILAFPSLNSELTLDTLHSDRNFPNLSIPLNALSLESLSNAVVNASNILDDTTIPRRLLCYCCLPRASSECAVDEFGRRSRDHASIENGLNGVAFVQMTIHRVILMASSPLVSSQFTQHVRISRSDHHVRSLSALRTTLIALQQRQGPFRAQARSHALARQYHRRRAQGTDRGKDADRKGQAEVDLQWKGAER